MTKLEENPSFPQQNNKLTVKIFPAKTTPASGFGFLGQLPSEFALLRVFSFSSVCPEKSDSLKESDIFSSAPFSAGTFSIHLFCTPGDTFLVSLGRSPSRQKFSHWSGRKGTFLVRGGVFHIRVRAVVRRAIDRGVIFTTA